jgi:hypothetical protein
VLFCYSHERGVKAHPSLCSKALPPLSALMATQTNSFVSILFIVEKHSPTVIFLTVFPFAIIKPESSAASNEKEHT